MIYNWTENLDLPTAILRSADGEVIPNVYEVDTETGRVETARRDKDNDLVAMYGRIVRETVYYKPPIEVIFDR